MKSNQRVAAHSPTYEQTAVLSNKHTVVCYQPRLNNHFQSPESSRKESKPASSLHICRFLPFLSQRSILHTGWLHLFVPNLIFQTLDLTSRLNHTIHLIALLLSLLFCHDVQTHTSSLPRRYFT